MDRRLDSDAAGSSPALVVAHLPAAAVEAPVDAEVRHWSVFARNGFEFATLNHACCGSDQDRVAVRHQETGVIVALADGAGGVGGGAAAAQTIVDGAQAWTPLSRTADDLIRDLDRHLASTTGGQSTAVILSLSATGMVGASVGDSGAWIISARGSPRSSARIDGLTDAIELAVGDRHACARQRNGQVLCWGDNSRGQLGIGESGFVHAPAIQESRTTERAPHPRP